jgi:Tol biopolymer transport system component
VQNVDGRGRHWLASGRAACWSPDGGKLALASDGKLVIRDLVEGVERPVFDRPTPRAISEIDWSPDGEQLSVVVRGGPLAELWIVDAAPSAEPKLRYSGGLEGGVSWSPARERLAVSED